MVLSAGINDLKEYDSIASVWNHCVHPVLVEVQQKNDSLSFYLLHFKVQYMDFKYMFCFKSEALITDYRRMLVPG